MAELESAGFLTKAYHSAGRIPTEAGYRYFVDHMVDTIKIDPRTRQAIWQDILQYHGELEGLLENTSRLLSKLSSWAGVVLAPRFAETKLQRISFVKLDSGNILVILVSQSEIVKSTILHPDEIYSEKDLVRAADYINERFAGFNLLEMGNALAAELQSEKRMVDRCASFLVDLNRNYFLDRLEAEEVYTGLTSDFFEKQSADNFEKLKSLYRALEEKRKLSTLLIDSTREEGIHVWIGSENPLTESADLSLITSKYACRDKVMGSLGIIGPVRMNYQKACTVVHNVAKYFGEKLSTVPIA
jgi:heat-inducible transcriptional repressor